MPDYTIITTTSVFEVRADRPRRDDDGDLYLYDDDADEPIGHVGGDRFVAIFESEHGLTNMDSNADSNADSQP